MEVKIPILAALIGALGGLVGGSVTSVANHFFGLQAKRQELLQEARRAAYVEWLEVRTLSREIDRLKSESKEEEAKKVREEFDRKGRAVMGKFAIYGGPNVVRSAALWYRTDTTSKPCTYSSQAEKAGLGSEISLHQAMRADLMPDEALPSDADMSLLLLQCELRLGSG